jgi:hypothetical protein
MRHSLLCGFATCVLIALGAFSVGAADWPQCRVDISLGHT